MRKLLPSWAGVLTRPKSTQPQDADPQNSSRFEHELLDAARSGVISEGLLQRGYHERRAHILQRRGAAQEQEGNLGDELAALEAELEALVELPPQASPEPTVLRSIAAILPFGKGQHRHG